MGLASSSLTSSYPSNISRFAGWALWLSLGGCAGLTWQLVMPAWGGIHQPDSSLFSLHDLPSARNREHWPAGDLWALLGANSGVLSKTDSLGVSGAMWVLALSLIRNHSEGSFDLRKGIAEELYSSPCQSINIIGSNKDKSSYHLFNPYYAPRTFRFILFVFLTTMKWYGS